MTTIISLTLVRYEKVVSALNAQLDELRHELVSPFRLNISAYYEQTAIRDRYQRQGRQLQETDEQNLLGVGYIEDLRSRVTRLIGHNSSSEVSANTSHRCRS